jgi:hypothetical protein
MLHNVWDVLGPWIIGAIGGLVGAAFLLPTKLGEALFKFRFDKAIEEYKADQTRQNEIFRADSSRELERLREQLSHLGDRGKRSNELEFAAIKAMWEAIVEAHLATSVSITSYTEYPDINKFNDEDLDAFLSTTGFSKQQNDQIKAADDHLDMFMKITTMRRIIDAQQKIYDARVLLRKQRIFMPEAVRFDFQSFIELLSGAQVERSLQFQHPNFPRNEWGNSIKRFYEEGEREYAALATAANQRLFREERAREMPISPANSTMAIP